MAEASFDGPPFAYANPVIRQLICAWKYDGDREGLATLHLLLLPRMASTIQAVTYHRVCGIVPVPLSAWKERWRGFHQTKDLSHVLATILHLSVFDLLERKHQWSAQANLPKAIRKGSLKNGKIMRVRSGYDVPRSVMLVDDVETTGATLDVAEAALREVGVETVIRWTLARG
jgi:ComF family protein